MGFSGRYRLVLLVWVAALLAALFALLWALARADLGAARLVAAVAVLATVTGLIRHVERTNETVARFVEALGHGDLATRFNSRGGAGFAELGRALNGAMRDLQATRDRSAEELRFLEALVDDMPVALLTIRPGDGVRLANKAARRLFGATETLGGEELARLGATFAARLTDTAPVRQELVILRLAGGPQRALLRAATLERLGESVRAVTVEPVQSTLDAIEVAAQTDLVRVLTHEILNSLTPVTSLGETAAALLAADPPDLPEARAAVTTLARRAAGLHRFVDSYRMVANPPVPRRRRFAAAPFAAELARLFAADWPTHRLLVQVAPDLDIQADPDLLAQALINLLRNAAQASSETSPEPTVRLAIGVERTGRLIISVEDNGPGIVESARSDIFLPFFTTRPTGTGVGLNLVRQIVVAHGWQIEVTTGPMGGALFWLGDLARH